MPATKSVRIGEGYARALKKLAAENDTTMTALLHAVILKAYPGMEKELKEKSPHIFNEDFKKANTVIDNINSHKYPTASIPSVWVSPPVPVSPKIAPKKASKYCPHGIALGGFCLRCLEEK